MSTNKIFYFLLFMNLIFQAYLSDEEEVDYSESPIDKMKNSIFNTKKEKIYFVGNLISESTVIGFSDLNNDKFTDIISYAKTDESTFEFYAHYYDKKNKIFNQKIKCFRIKLNENNNYIENKEKVSVRNLQTFYYKSTPHFIVSFNNGDNKTLSHYVVKNNTEIISEVDTPLDFTSNILILNKNEEDNTRILCNDDKNILKICLLYDGLHCQYSNFSQNLTDPSALKDYPLSLKGGLGYVDLNGNCNPDFILSFDKGSETVIQVFTSRKDPKYKYSLNCELNLDSDEFGAFAITNLRDDKKEKSLPLLSLLIPKKNSNQVFHFKNQLNINYKWSENYCKEEEDKDKNKEIEGTIFSQSNYSVYNLTIGGKENPKFDTDYPTIIRVGDFLGTSNPGLIVKQKVEGKSQISLYERSEGTFKYYTGIDVNKIDKVEDEEPKMGLFFDINESGSLSFIIPTYKNNNYFFFNYRRNIYFIKAKLMNDKEKFGDTNFGASYRYIVTDKKGDRHMDVSCQLAQTSDTNIPVPYSITGLDDTNNYIEYFQTISGNILDLTKNDCDKKNERNYKGNTPVIPNTQMMISKFYNKKSKIEWNVDLIVQPMEQVWLFLVIVIIVLVIVLAVIIYLHLKEVKVEQKETNKFKSWFA